jgi:hypothetical protein
LVEVIPHDDVSDLVEAAPKAVTVELVFGRAHGNSLLGEQY